MNSYLFRAVKYNPIHPLRRLLSSERSSAHRASPVTEGWV